MNYNEIKHYLKQHQCKECFGLGQVNDAEPGDIFFNKWECPQCHGTGFNDGKHRVITIGGYENAEGV